jgi:hypothetical protein
VVLDPWGEDREEEAPGKENRDESVNGHWYHKFMMPQPKKKKVMDKNITYLYYTYNIFLQQINPFRLCGTL